LHCVFTVHASMCVMLHNNKGDCQTTGYLYMASMQPVCLRVGCTRPLLACVYLLCMGVRLQRICLLRPNNKDKYPESLFM
jgi:hypothetical protein